jgi:hypothetical protein
MLTARDTQPRKLSPMPLYGTAEYLEWVCGKRGVSKSGRGTVCDALRGKISPKAVIGRAIYFGIPFFGNRILFFSYPAIIGDY